MTKLLVWYNVGPLSNTPPVGVILVLLAKMNQRPSTMLTFKNSTCEPVTWMTLVWILFPNMWLVRQPWLSSFNPSSLSLPDDHWKPLTNVGFNYLDFCYPSNSTTHHWNSSVCICFRRPFNFISLRHCGRQTGTRWGKTIQLSIRVLLFTNWLCVVEADNRLDEAIPFRIIVPAFRNTWTKWVKRMFKHGIANMLENGNFQPN